MRKILAFMLVFCFMLVTVSCKDTKEEESTAALTVAVETTAFYEETTASELQTEESTTAEQTTAEVTTSEVQTTEILTSEIQSAEIETTAAPVTEAPVTEDGPSSWDIEKTVSFYKSAAVNTDTSVKSEQTVGLQDISVNNGQLGGVFSFVTPILSSFLSGKATVTDGVTGDFEKLTAEDISKAAAYATEKGTVVELTLKEQEDNASNENRDGSVSHGISTVGDLLGIMSQLSEKGLPIEINVEKTVLKYKNPVIKVLIDENGKIASGTWSCTVEINLSDYTFAGSRVDSTVVVLDNKITVNGGFNP